MCFKHLKAHEFNGKKIKRYLKAAQRRREHLEHSGYGTLNANSTKAFTTSAIATTRAIGNKADKAEKQRQFQREVNEPFKPLYNKITKRNVPMAHKMGYLRC